MKPDIAAGQVWTPLRHAGASDEEITVVQCDGRNVLWRSSKSNDFRQWSLRDFRAWVARTGARAA